MKTETINRKAYKKPSVQVIQIEMDKNLSSRQVIITKARRMIR